MTARRRLPGGRVLVLAAHPDDEAIGCGGALVLHHQQGDRIKVLFVTDGAGFDEGNKRLVRVRRSEARQAARIIGVDELEFWDYPDGRLSSMGDGLDERLAALLERERPAVVYRPLAHDPHPDHRRLAEAFESARRLARRAPDLADRGYQISGGIGSDATEVDITDVWPLKIEAIRRYKSQLRLQYDYVKMVSRLNAARGLLMGRSKYAEGFCLRRSEIG